MGCSRLPRYGVKAYNTWRYFNTRRAYERFLEDWIAATNGSERDRAVNALTALASGYNYYDSDNG